jgi:hypothetical protein
MSRLQIAADQAFGIAALCAFPSLLVGTLLPSGPLAVLLLLFGYAGVLIIAAGSAVWAVRDADRRGFILIAKISAVAAPVVLVGGLLYRAFGIRVESPEVLPLLALAVLVGFLPFRRELFGAGSNTR